MQSSVRGSVVESDIEPEKSEPPFEPHQHQAISAMSGLETGRVPHSNPGSNIGGPVDAHVDGKRQGWFDECGA